MNFIDVLFYLFLLLTPFASGMYFEKDFAWGALFITICFFGELVRKDKQLKDTKWIWLVAAAIFLSCNLTYLINMLWFNEVRSAELFAFGNVQLYEMIFLGIVTYLRLNRLKTDKTKFRNEIKTCETAIIASTVIMALLTFIPYFYRDGRFEGTFYYANTCAMFMLAGVALLYNFKFETKKKMHNVFRWIFIALNMFALFQTESRWSYAMTALYIFYEICKKVFKKGDTKKKTIIKASIVSGTIIVLACFGVLFIKSQTGGRLDSDLILHDFKLRQSYLYEANEIIKDYPFGLGYEGYLEHQAIKENKYTLRLVHNLPYQIVLNYGVQTLLLMFALASSYIMICSNNKKLFDISNIILILIFIHSLLDIDFSFLAIDNLLIVICAKNLFDTNE